MSVLFSPFGNQQFSASGTALAVGHKIYTYAAGSSTPLATYTDSTGAIAQTNPIILNSLGMPTNGQIWLTSGLAYKLVWKDAADVLIDEQDDITGVTGSASVSQWQASGITPTYVSATSLTLAGDQTSEFHVGRRLQSTNTAGTVYSTISASAYGVLTTVTVVNDGSSVLDSGLSQVNYGLLTATNPSTPRVLSISSINGGQIGGFRNLIVNGNFARNERSYVSGTATTVANQYTLDMWRVVTSGQSLTFTTLGNGRQVTAPAGGMEQVIDGASIGGTAYTINWAGTATCTVDGVAKTKGASVTLVPGTNATVRFTSGTVSTVQLEHGAVASAFEYLQPAIDLSRCQYYFRRIARTSVGIFGPVGQVQTATSVVFGFPFSMRATPTPTYSSVSINDATALSAVTGLAAEATAGGHVFLTVTAGGGGLTAGRAAVLYTAASGYIDLSAEPT